MNKILNKMICLSSASEDEHNWTNHKDLTVFLWDSHDPCVHGVMFSFKPKMIDKEDCIMAIEQ